MSFSCSSYSIQGPRLHLVVMPFYNLGFEFPRHSLNVFDDSEEYWSGIFRIHFIKIRWFFFFIFTLWLKFGGGISWGQVPFSSHHSKRSYYLHNLWLDIDLAHLTEVMFVRFHHCKITPSPHTHTPLSLLYSLEEVTIFSLHLKSEELSSRMANVNYLESFYMRDLSLLPFIQLMSV